MSPFTPSRLSSPLRSSASFSFLCRSFANHNSYFSAAQFLSAAISVLFPLSLFYALFPLQLHLRLCNSNHRIFTSSTPPTHHSSFHWIASWLHILGRRASPVIGMSCLLTDEGADGYRLAVGCCWLCRYEFRLVNKQEMLQQMNKENRRREWGRRKED